MPISGVAEIVDQRRHVFGHNGIFEVSSGLAFPFLAFMRKEGLMVTAYAAGSFREIHCFVLSSTERAFRLLRGSEFFRWEEANRTMFVEPKPADHTGGCMYANAFAIRL